MIGNDVIAMDRPAAKSRARRLLIAAIFVALGLLALVPAIAAGSATRLTRWVTPW